MNNINHQKRQFVIDTLINLADSSPVKKNYRNSIYGTSHNRYDISQQELNIWIEYINSVLDILSDYITQAEITLIKTQIRNIVSQNGSTYAMYALNIERELLNFAQNILRYYK